MSLEMMMMSKGLLTISTLEWTELLVDGPDVFLQVGSAADHLGAVRTLFSDRDTAAAS